MSKAKIAWAREIGTEITRHITEVERGLACNCVCEGCNTRLEAVNSRNRNAVRRPHFRHYEVPESGDCAERALLAAARRSLSGNRIIKIPSFSVAATILDSRGVAHHCAAESAESELVYRSIAFIDDALALLTLEDGRNVYIILRVATEHFRPDIPNGAPVMIFDLEGRQLEHPDPEALRTRIQLVARNKCWLEHLDAGHLFAQAEQLARMAARRADEEYAVATASFAAKLAAADHTSLLPGPESVAAASSPQEATPAPTTKAAEEERERRVEVSAYPLEWAAPPVEASKKRAMQRYAIAWSTLPWGDIYDTAATARDAGSTPEAAVLKIAVDYDARIGVVRDFMVLALLIRQKTKR